MKMTRSELKSMIREVLHEELKLTEAVETYQYFVDGYGKEAISEKEAIKVLSQSWNTTFGGKLSSEEQARYAQSTLATLRQQADKGEEATFSTVHQGKVKVVRA